MEPVSHSFNTFEVKEENFINKNPTDIKIKKLFGSRKSNALISSDEDELPRAVTNEDKRDSIEKVRVRRNSQEQVRDRKGSREIYIKLSPRTEVEFAKNS